MAPILDALSAHDLSDKVPRAEATSHQCSETAIANPQHLQKPLDRVR